VVGTVSGTVRPIATHGDRAGVAVIVGQYNHPQAIVAVPPTSEAQRGAAPRRTADGPSLASRGAIGQREAR
jgi:hypothetical protein